MKRTLLVLICAVLALYFLFIPSPVQKYQTSASNPSIESSSRLSHESSSLPKPTYSFIINFGVPKVPARDFDQQSLTHRFIVFALSLNVAMAATNASAELIIVQWAPSVNGSLLGLVKWEQLALQSLEMVRVIEVPEEVAQRAPPCIQSLDPLLHAEEGVVCFEFVAKNAGARRALGQFLVMLNIDDILTPELGSLFANASLWKQNTYWRAQRIQLPNKIALEDFSSGEEVYQMALAQLNWEQQQQQGADNPNGSADSILGPMVAKTLDQITALCGGHGGDFMLMRSDDFIRVGGYPELGIDYHMDNVFLAVASAKGMLVAGLRRPYAVFHQKHRGRNSKFRANQVDRDSLAKYLGVNATDIEVGKPLTHSNPRWGLADVDLPETCFIKGKLDHAHKILN